MDSVQQIVFTAPESEADKEIFISEFFQDFEPEKAKNLEYLKSLETSKVMVLGDLTIQFPKSLRMIKQILFGRMTKSFGFSEINRDYTYQMDSKETYYNDSNGTFAWINLTNVISETMEFSIEFITDLFDGKGFSKLRDISFEISNLETGSYKIEIDDIKISFNVVEVDLTAAREFLEFAEND